MPSFFNLSWLQWLLVALVMTQTTILCVTIYLHRSQAHRALDVHPALAHAIRFWLWLSTSMSTLQWVAVHRKHHAFCETEQDPHSPKILGLRTVLFKGALLYRAASRDPEVLTRYGHGAPNDWLEHNVYIRASLLGPALMVLVNLALFGLVQGLVLSLAQFLWIPTWAAGVINGLAHHSGYRNFGSPDESRNLLPWGLWIGGEELHNNHHAHATSAKLSYHWWELDIGWGAIRVLELLGLAKVKRAVRPPLLAPLPAECSPALVRALGQHRLQVSRWFHGAWHQTLSEMRQRNTLSRQQAVALKHKLVSLSPSCQHRELVAGSAELSTLRAHWHQLEDLWSNRKATADELAAALKDWCERAESSGVRALERLSLRLRCMQA